MSLLGDTVVSGFAAAMCLVRIEPGSDVIVLGACAFGLGAVQAARVMGARQVIAVEPVRHRHAAALKASGVVPFVLHTFRHTCITRSVGRNTWTFHASRLGRTHGHEHNEANRSSKR